MAATSTTNSATSGLAETDGGVIAESSVWEEVNGTGDVDIMTDGSEANVDNDFGHGDGTEDDEVDGETSSASTMLEDDCEASIEWIYPKSFKLRNTVLSILDGQCRVADDIYGMYDSLTQWSERLVPEPVIVPDYVHQFPSSVKEFINHYNKETLSVPSINRLYALFVRYENGLPEELRVLTKHIPRESAVHRKLRVVRMAKLYEEGWKVAVIDLNDLHAPLGLGIPINRSGTFRCPLRIALHELDHRGVTPLQPFKACWDDSDC